MKYIFISFFSILFFLTSDVADLASLCVLDNVEIVDLVEEDATDAEDEKTETENYLFGKISIHLSSFYLKGGNLTKLQFKYKSPLISIFTPPPEFS